MPIPPQMVHGPPNFRPQLPFYAFPAQHTHFLYWCRLVSITYSRPEIQLVEYDSAFVNQESPYNR